MRCLTRRFQRAALLVTALLGSVSSQAMTVVDPANLIQNTLTAVRTLEMINNQISELQNQSQMLKNQARNLSRLDYNAMDQLAASLANTERLISQAQGLAYEIKRLDQEFSRLYPNQYSADTSSEELALETRERWKKGLDSLQTAMRVQAQVRQNLGQDEATLANLLNQSQSAEGALQASQATNQLLALQAKQSIQSQQLQITQNRAVATELARQAAAQEKARELSRRFMGSGTPYTPHPVQFYR